MDDREDLDTLLGRLPVLYRKLDRLLGLSIDAELPSQTKRIITQFEQQETMLKGVESLLHCIKSFKPEALDDPKVQEYLSNRLQKLGSGPNWNIADH